MTTQNFISAYSKKKKSQISFGTKSRTKQNHAKQCDINNIMKRYHKTGLLEHSRKHSPEYGFATSEDFNTSMNIITKANEMFEDLPSDIRTRFQNDPGQFLDFVDDENNAQEMFDLGLTQVNPYLDKTHAESEDTSDSQGSNPDVIAEGETAEKES